jgi:acetylornithine deacetylase
MDAVATLLDLMAIESHDSVDTIRDHLVDIIPGATVDPSGCVVARRGDPAAGPHVVLNSHMDVVPPHIPPEQDGDIITGRGACDAKGCLTPMLSAFVATKPTTGCIELVISPDEETVNLGLAEYLADGHPADLAVVGEPTGLDLCPSARGHFDIQIEFEGRAAHGGTPESGLNATVCAAAAVQRIGALEPMTDVTVGANSATPTIITAGERANQVPDSATLVVDYRPIPGETEASVQERIADALAASACPVTIDMYPPGARLGPFKTSHDHRYVRVMQQTASAVRDEPVAVHSFPAATEAAFFDPLMPTIVFGPGQIADGETPIAHSKDEYVRASSVQTAAAVLEAFLEEMVVDAAMA